MIKPAIGLLTLQITADEQDYDSALDLHLVESFIPFEDKPSSKVTKILAETFDLPYDPSLGRYECQISSKVQAAADRYLRSVSKMREGGFNSVIFHPMGWSSPHRKNLLEWQAGEICDMVIASGRVPVVLDWERRIDLIDNKKVFCPPKEVWHDDATFIAGLIRSSEAFVGVDSGPGKLASTTETPSLVLWIKNHPAQYHDPAPNTTHLIPTGWKDMAPLDGNEAVINFKSHYLYRTYSGDHGLVAQVLFWLAETLQVGVQVASIKFVVPGGTQTASWACRKMRGIAQGRPIDVFVSGDVRFPDEALNVYLALPWVRSVQMTNVPVHVGPEKPKNTRGHHLFVPEGVRGGYYYLIPDATFEAGRAFEDWLPGIPSEPE